MLAPIVASLFATQALAITYRLCDDSVYPLSGLNLTIPLVLGPSQAVTINGQVKAVTVTGTVVIVDGCHVR
jgi:hypothetical protein